MTIPIPVALTQKTQILTRGSLVAKAYTIILVSHNIGTHMTLFFSVYLLLIYKIDILSDIWIRKLWADIKINWYVGWKHYFFLQRYYWRFFSENFFKKKKKVYRIHFGRDYDRQTPLDTLPLVDDTTRHWS